MTISRLKQLGSILDSLFDKLNINVNNVYTEIITENAKAQIQMIQIRV